MARSTFAYVTYIRTTPEKLWSALTDAELIKKYWFGVRCENQWTTGSSWELVSVAWPMVISNLKSLLETGTIVLKNPIPLRAPILKRSNYGKGNFWKSFVSSSSAARSRQHS